MENKSLYAIVNESMEIEKLLVESGGEITEEIEKALSVNASELSLKVDGYQHVIERFNSLSDHYKARAEFFRTIAGQCKTAADRLKDNIKNAMIDMGIEEVKGQDMRFKLSPTSGTLIIEDAEMIPVEFKSEVITTEIDKKALKDAAAKGEVAGVRIEPGFTLRSYANTPEKKSKTKEVANV